MGKFIFWAMLAAVVSALAILAYVVPTRMVQAEILAANIATATEPATSTVSAPIVTIGQGGTSRVDTGVVVVDTLHIRSTRSLAFGTSNVVGYWSRGATVRGVCSVDPEGVVWIAAREGWSVVRNSSDVFIDGACFEAKP